MARGRRPCVRRERCCPRSLRRPSTWPAPGCMRGTWRRPPASASSRSWPSSCWRPAPRSGPAMRRGCSNWPPPNMCPRPAEALDALTFEVDPHTKGSDQVEAGFCFRGRRLSAEPWFPVPWPILDPPDVAQLTREARDADYEELPDARPGETFRWHAYPPDQDAYEEFVRYALRRASQLDPTRRAVGAVRERPRGRAGRADDHPVLARGPGVRAPAPTDDRNPSGTGSSTGRVARRTPRFCAAAGDEEPGGTIQIRPSIGSVSRAVGHETIGKQGQSEVTRRPREWSFVTLDHPTFETRPGSGALWDRVIMPLVDLENGTRRRLRVAGAGVHSSAKASHSSTTASTCRALASTRWRGRTRCACDGARSAGCPPHSSRAIASGTSSG